jgi:hypothetical protein
MTDFKPVQTARAILPSLVQRASAREKESEMFRMIKIAAMSTLIGLGAFAAAPATAQASGLVIGVSSHGPAYGHGRDWRRHACTPREAVARASRIGIRNARVRSVRRNTIDVSGFRHGRHVNVTFSKAPGCPTIRW